MNSPEEQRNMARALSLMKLSFIQSTILRSCPKLQKEIAQDMNISDAGISSAVKNLVSRRLVRKTDFDEDNRKAFLEPTPLGLTAQEALNDIIAGAPTDDVKKAFPNLFPIPRSSKPSGRKA